MTHAAIAQLLEPVGADVVFGHQFLAARELVFRRLPFRIENLIAGAEKFLRRLVAIQTPAHVERMRFPRNGHLINGTVAGRTTDAFLDVNAVIEENEIGQLIHPLPANGLSSRHALADGRENRGILPDLRMTSHARFGRRQSGEGGFFNRRVTVAAIKPQPRHVMFVAEGGRLRERHIDLGGVRRAVDCIHDAPETEESDEGTRQRCSRNAVAAPAKNLGHNFAAKKYSRVQTPKINPAELRKLCWWA